MKAWKAVSYSTHSMATIDAVINSISNLKHVNRLENTQTHPLSLNFTKSPTIAQLQQNLANYSNKQIQEQVSNNPFIKRLEWPGFETYLTQYFEVIRDFDPWSLLNSIDLLIKSFELSCILINPKSEMYASEIPTNSSISLFYESVSLILPLSEFMDRQSMNLNNRIDYFPRLTHISSILLKSLNNLRSTPDINTEKHVDKINLLMFISNKLCQVYYKIKSPILCQNVFSNINILNLNKQFILKKNLLVYKFVVGKYYFHQSLFIDAFRHLEASFNLLSVNSPIHNFQIILRYLIPASLLVGKVPNLQFFSNFLSDYEMRLYGPLIQYFKQGNVSGVFAVVAEHERYFKTIGVFNGFLQRLRLLVLRNLLFRVYRMNNGKLTWDIVKRSIMLSCEGLKNLEEIYTISVDMSSDYVIQNVLASLNTSGLMKVKLASSNSFVLSKSDTFPEVFGVINSRNPKQPREMWL